MLCKRKNLKTLGLREHSHMTSYFWVGRYTQSPIIKNCPIRNDAEILGKFKERTVNRSKIKERIIC